MPQFFFAVGFAYRLTYLRRQEREGTRAAVSHAIGRDLGLILLGILWYHLGGKIQRWAELQELGLWEIIRRDFGRSPFETLTLIGMTSLWVLPVIGGSTNLRIGFTIGSALLHLILSHLFYFDWAWNRPVIDGGPLSVLTWTIPILVGSLTFDAMNSQKEGWFARQTALAVGLMILAIGLSRIGGVFSWPFLTPGSEPPNLWTMSQRTGSVTYLTFATGFALAVQLGCVVLCDWQRWELSLFGLLGRNALAGYLVHGIVAQTVKPYTPNDAPAWYVTASFLIYFAISCLVIRHLERRGARI